MIIGKNKLLSWRGIDERSQESSARFRRRRRNQVEPEHLRQVSFVAKTRRETGCSGAGRQAHGEIKIALVPRVTALQICKRSTQNSIDSVQSAY